jgi:hypothetical protein
MKSLFLMIAFVSTFSIVQGQTSLANTAWKGHANVPELSQIILHFAQDTVYMYMLPEMQVAEKMVYTTMDSTFTWRKISGGSPCPTTAIGIVHYSIKGNELSMKIVSDDCEARKRAEIGETFMKIQSAMTNYLNLPLLPLHTLK